MPDVAFWAGSANEREASSLYLPGGIREGRVLQAVPYSHMSDVQFNRRLHPAGRWSGGTGLTLTDTGVSPLDRTEVIAGWVSVLMALKAAVDFGVDLRTHDPMRNWDSGFVEN
jgi:hypothetical protein